MGGYTKHNEGGFLQEAEDTRIDEDRDGLWNVLPDQSLFTWGALVYAIESI